MPITINSVILNFTLKKKLPAISSIYVTDITYQRCIVRQIGGPMEKFRLVILMEILGPSVLFLINCGGPITKPPDGEMSITTKVGKLTAQYRIYADKDWLDDLNEPSDDIVVKIDTSYLPDNMKIIWIVRDPDDPANHFVLDENDNPDDNFGQTEEGYNCEFGWCNDHGSIYQDSMYITNINWWNESSVRIIAPPNLTIPGEEEYIGGDNYVVVAKIGNLSGDSIVSDIITLRKRLMLEYDYGKDCRTGDETVFDRLQRAFSGNDIYGNWDPNYCPWIDVKYEHLLIADDTVPRIVPSYPPSIYFSCERFAEAYKDDDFGHPVHLFSVWDFAVPLDSTEHGASNNYWQYPEGRKWSFLWMKNITNHPPQELTVDEWRGAVTVHELGHQIGRLVHDPLTHTGDCIMLEGCGTNASNPRYCPYCVNMLRYHNIYFYSNNNKTTRRKQ